ncbi:HAD domain-containing protein [Actinokineospora fastidiosa]|uniref:Secreted protein n=1 Tax=Actinokineospora fastidiosa TaxID=1816 RepID=A0A918GPK2_9PSEU|nr:HAD domain-containing protein [Actinokineospora fastidiosa]GGS52753.1 hypothetical protein GCM10010171_54790 [Actinokineospora fastidiosa]
MRPLLYLDVDGPLIPFGGDPVEHGPADSANPLLNRIDPGLGPPLLALGCTLVWATTWMADANERVAPVLGLPDLAVVDWPDPRRDGVDAWFGLHWKTRPLVERSAGRPFIWVDDEITDADRAWVAEHHPGPALLHRVDPARGLTTGDLAHLARWVAAVKADHSHDRII